MAEGEWRAPKPGFVGDDEILKWLKRPFKIGAIATKLNTSLSRCQHILSEHKVEILTERIRKHGQTADQMTYQLGLTLKLDQIREWVRRNFEKETNQ